MAGVSAPAGSPAWGERALAHVSTWIGDQPEGPDGSLPSVLAVALAGHLVDQVDEVIALRGWAEPTVRLFALAQQAVGCELRTAEGALLLRLEPSGAWRLLHLEGEALLATPQPAARLDLDHPWTVAGQQPMGQFRDLVPWLDRLLGGSAPAS